MSRSRHVAVAAITLGVTLGTGLVADNRDAIEARLGLTGGSARAASASAPSAAMPAPAPARLPLAAGLEVAGPLALAGSPVRPLPGGGPAGDAVAALRDVVPVAFEAPSFEAPSFDASPAGVGEVVPEALVPAAAPGPAPEVACALTLSAVPGPAAMIDLAASAPCAAGGALTLHHEGMTVRVALDAQGRAALALPALADPAVVMAEAGEGARRAAAVATAAVPDLALLDRAVLQWQGAEGPEMHAREFGAAYGSPGDLWRGAPGAAEAAMAGTGGFLVTLGDPALPAPRLAEVYTFPSGASRQAGTVDLTVEAEVTGATCGREVAAQTIQVSRGKAPFAFDLALPMPPCDALGEWLVLDEMLLDLTVTAL